MQGDALMKVNFCGYNYRHDDTFYVERPTGARDYMLLIIRSPGRILLNERSYYVERNAVILYNKGTPQYFGAHNAEYINDWVSFDLDEDDIAWCTHIGIQFDTVLEYFDVYQLSHLVKQLSMEQWADNPNTETSENYLLRLLLLKLADLISKPSRNSSKISTKLQTLRRRIYDHPELDWSTESICQSLSISPSYLYYAYKQILGTTVKADVIASRLEYSKHLLTYSNYSISEISHMVGYENDVHYMYMFKKATGLTPTQYRKSSANQK